MIANTSNEHESSAFARSVLNVAAEVDAAETRIKQAILDAANEGDAPRVVEIVTRWQQVPATEVLATTSQHGKKPALPPSSP